MHAQQVVNRTNFSCIPSSTLVFKNVLLATNQRISEDSVASFFIAELVSLNVSLQFLVDGLAKILTGEAYIQFTYFSATREAQDFFNTFNAHPPYPSPEFETTSDRIDASVIITENSVAHVEFPSDISVVNNSEISNSYCSLTDISCSPLSLTTTSPPQMM